MKPSPTHQVQISHPAPKLPQNLNIIKPLNSRKFRTNTIDSILTEHFKRCWENCKSTSPKLSFYHSCKAGFFREDYLDICKGFSRRYSTTKLRISSHDLEIEYGRYQNKPREERICEWCKTSIGLNTVENEIHVICECDLYQEHRLKFINNLKKAPPITDCETANIKLNPTVGELKTLTMSLLSPNTPNNQSTDITSHIHLHANFSIEPNTPAHSSFNARRSYVINCVCTYILKCFEKRDKFINDLRKSRAQLNSVTFNILRA